MSAKIKEMQEDARRKGEDAARQTADIRRKQQGAPAAKASVVGVCVECACARRGPDGHLRCHALPPVVWFPYRDMSVWPVVEPDGGCAAHFKRRPA